MNVVRLNQSGLPPQKRFSFYDQIHTTGMDIHQCIDARAALTLGKDMTFRDYAQGAFRMRGIGKGQTIELFLIPEVMRLIADQMRRCAGKQIGQAQQFQAPAPAPVTGYAADLMSLGPTPLTQPPPQNIGSGRQLLINVAAWLTVNGMKSENMQFRMLCHQSIDNVSRKRAYHMLTMHYRELTQLAFASRLKEFANMSGKQGSTQNDGTAGLEEWLAGSKNILQDDIAAVKSVVVPDKSQGKKGTVGIDKIQKAILVLTERLDFALQNSIPMPVPLSDTLRNSVLRRQEFITNDYDKAVVDKILMVLVTSEGNAKKQVGEAAVLETDEEDKDANLQKEQTAEEEVLKEQVSFTKTHVSHILSFNQSFSPNFFIPMFLGGGGRRGGGRGRRRRGGGSCRRICEKEEVFSRR
jgi:hypothetical protein